MGYGGGYSGNYMGLGGFGGLAVLLFGALIVVGIVLLVIWATRMSASHGSHGVAAPPPMSMVGHDEAIATAKKRLASGEITKDQYLEIMQALKN